MKNYLSNEGASRNGVIINLEKLFEELTRK